MCVDDCLRILLKILSSWFASGSWLEAGKIRDDAMNVELFLWRRGSKLTSRKKKKNWADYNLSDIGNRKMEFEMS